MFLYHFATFGNIFDMFLQYSVLCGRNTTHTAPKYLENIVKICLLEIL